VSSIVMVVSGANLWTMKNAQPHPTGFWSEEFVTPHRKFTEAGFKVTVASPGGVTPTVDPLSFNLAYDNNDESKVSEQQDYMRRLGPALTSPMRVEDISPDQFDVIFLVGGHGPMQDMAVYSTIGPVLVAMLDNPRKIVAAVCHGPAGFFTASRADGTWAFKDRRSPASAMRKRRRQALRAMRRGSWKIVSASVERATLRSRPGRRMRLSMATLSQVSRTILQG
jgi:putative intracellular protease/amidase